GSDKTTTSPTPADKASHYHGHRQRLRQRFLAAGSEAISDYEMLELILFRAIPQRDVKPLAKELLATFGSFSEVIAAPLERLKEVDGLGEAAITELKIVQAAANRLVRGEVKQRQVLSSWSNVLDYCRDGLREQRTLPHSVPRQGQPLDRRRAVPDRHRRSHPGLSARGGQTRARTLRHRRHPGAQPSLRRSHPLARRYRHDAGDRRGRASTRDRRARPPHRRQGRTREPEGAEADLAGRRGEMRCRRGALMARYVGAPSL